MNYPKPINISDLQIYQKLRIYLQFFYWMGLSPHFLFKNSSGKQIKYKFINYLPAIFWILSTIILLVVAIKVHINFNKEHPIQNLIISIVCMILESFVSITIYSQSFFNKSTIKSIIEHFQFLLNFFQYKFQFQISLSEYMRETRRDFLKISFMFLFGVTIYGVMKTLVVVRRDGALSFFIDALQLPVIIACLHCVLYINLAKHMMSKLNALIMQNHDCNQIKVNRMNSILPCRRQFCDENRLISIKRMKLIYYRLWRITQLISDSFGWVIAAIIIQNFVFVTFGLYWGYVLLLNKKQLKSISFTMIGPVVSVVTPAFTTTILIYSAQKLYQQVRFKLFRPWFRHYFQFESFKEINFLRFFLSL